MTPTFSYWPNSIESPPCKLKDILGGGALFVRPITGLIWRMAELTVSAFWRLEGTLAGSSKFRVPGMGVGVLKTLCGIALLLAFPPKSPVPPPL